MIAARRGELQGRSRLSGLSEGQLIGSGLINTGNKRYGISEPERFTIAMPRATKIMLPIKPRDKPSPKRMLLKMTPIIGLAK